MMGIITVKNGSLYRAWIKQLCKVEGLENSTPQIRTRAFFESQAGNPVQY